MKAKKKLYNGGGILDGIKPKKKKKMQAVKAPQVEPQESVQEEPQEGKEEDAVVGSVSVGGKDYYLSPEESKRFEYVKGKSWDKYSKEHGEDSESDFFMDFMTGEGKEYLESGKYKEEYEESDEDYMERSMDAWKKYALSTDNPKETVNDEELMGQFIKYYIQNEKKKKFYKGGIIPKYRA